MNKKFVIECSSIYDIDFAAVVFSIINNDECEYEIYLNEAADTKTEFRRFVSRLAIPTLSWENDPHDVLRQKHLALDSLEVEEFLELLNNAIHSYIQLLKGKYDRYHKQLLERLKSELLADQLNNVIDCYKRLIELIIELITGKRIRISLFGDIRTGERTDICRKSVYNIYKEIEKLNPGRYKFVKGGRIEIELDGEWIGIKRFYKEDKRIIFTDDEGHLYSFEDIVSSRAIRFRGPIETALIFSIGTLIDLPWYMGAVMSYEPVDMSGIEYISPISISSTMRVSKMAGGNGMRLCPSGYSLIDYEADNVLLLLMNIYPEDKIIDHEDLNSWKIIVNNYPVSNQKLSKSQSSIPALCNIIKKQGILDENGIKCNRTEYKNYIRMGDAILEIYNTFRFLRQYINNKSPFYHNENLRGVFYFANNFTNIIFLYDDSKEILEQLNRFLAFFGCNTSCVEDCMQMLEDYKIYFIFDETEINIEKFISFCSKFEKNVIKCMHSYYKVAAFISCVLLKANIFSAFCVLGESYKKCVQGILEHRVERKLYFKPIYFEEE